MRVFACVCVCVYNVLQSGSLDTRIIAAAAAPTLLGISTRSARDDGH